MAKANHERAFADHSLQRAMSVSEFCKRYAIGRTSVYQEIKQKRLRARKVGAKTVITADDAEDWLRQLPEIDS